MKSFLALILLFTMLYMPVSWAQCGYAVNVGGQCIPPDVLNPPGDSNQHAQPQQPQAVWATRWGAIATDASTDAAGTVEGQASKSAAEKAALSICASHGSPHCEMRFTFHNQCAAAALGEGKLGYAGSATRELAEQLAIKSCGYGDLCKIVYSACSLPVRVQ